MCSDHPYFVAVQYHPEYISRPMKASPPYFGLLLAACGKLPYYLSRGCRLSPQMPNSEESGTDDDDMSLELASMSSTNGEKSGASST